MYPLVSLPRGILKDLMGHFSPDNWGEVAKTKSVVKPAVCFSKIQTGYHSRCQYLQEDHYFISLQKYSCIATSVSP